jgi:hypothetical protein
MGDFAAALLIPIMALSIPIIVIISKHIENTQKNKIREMEL